MKQISIVVPCYNEEETVNIFYNEIKKHYVDKYEFILIFVDDGSTDKTLELITKLHKEDKNVKYISFSRNFGKEAAMLAGLEFAYKMEVDATVIMDVDLQDPPQLIKEMVEYYEQGYKHVFAKHRSRKDEPRIRTFFAMSFYKVYAFLTKDKHVVRGARDYSLLDRDVIKAFIDVNDYTRFTKGIFSWVGFEKKCIEFDYVKRSAGKTKWSFMGLFKYAITGINQFSHFYKILPHFTATLIGIMIVFDLFNINFNNQMELQIFGVEVVLFLITLILTTLMNLNYDIRDHGLNRPKYIVEQSNIEIKS